MYSPSTIDFMFVNSRLSESEQQALWPKRQSELASGFDLASASQEIIVISPGERKLIPTGIVLGLTAGLEAQVRSRSGLALKHGIITLNSPGTIDADYRGEIKVILANLGLESFQISFGMRIAQLVIAPVCLPNMCLQTSLLSSQRGEGGFGSTGISFSGPDSGNRAS